MWKIALDVVVTVSAYLGAEILRFGTHLTDLISPARHTLPLVAVAQLIGVAIAGGYARRSLAPSTRRFLLGASAGSIAAGVLIDLWFGRAALSVSALFADLVLCLMGGLLWRCSAMVGGTGKSQPVAPVQIPAHMHAMGGPRSLFLSFTDMLRYRTLVNSLVARDLKLKYRGSVLGFFWSLLNPLVMVGVYTIVFTFLFRQRQPGFVLKLSVGLLAWGLFANSAMMSTSAIVDSGGLIKSVHFPRSILPLATVLFNLSLYLLTLAVFLPVLFAWYRISPATPMAAFPLFLALHFALCTGVAFALSAVTATYRDVKHLTEIALAVLFWMTPIMYSVDDLQEWIRVPVLLSPMSPFVMAYQQMFYSQRWPDPQLWVLCTFYAAAALMIGATLFSSLEARFGEQV